MAAVPPDAPQTPFREAPMSTMELEAPGGAVDLGETTAEMARCILSHCDFDRTDRLAPSFNTVYETNPMSLAYGACGIALFLHRATGGLPERVEHWLLDQPLTLEKYAPSLFLGLSGIAVSFWELGLPEKAEEAMRLAYQSPLLYEEAGMYVGAAGWGWASLYFWDHTRRQEYLDRAVQAGDFVLGTAEPEGDTHHWRHASDGKKIHYGYGFGAAGVGLFLLNLALRTGRDDFMAGARKALDYDLAQGLEGTNGLVWKRFEDDRLLYHYFLHGAAGIGSVAVRFAHLLGNADYLEMSRRIADSTNIKWTVFPGMLHGLSGIAEYAIDMYRCTGEEAYMALARDQADTVLWFRVRRPQGIAFPGAGLTKICHEWATGTAGVGMFLLRLQNPGPRLPLDLPATPLRGAGR